jgi:hypothetical protein
MEVILVLSFCLMGMFTGGLYLGQRISKQEARRAWMTLVDESTGVLIQDESKGIKLPVGKYIIVSEASLIKMGKSIGS